MTSMTFSSLPVEIKQVIFNKLNTSELLPLRSVCKEWQRAIDTATQIWKVRCQEAFNLPLNFPVNNWHQLFVQTHKNWFEGRCVSRTINDSHDNDNSIKNYSTSYLEGGQLFRLNGNRQIDLCSPLFTIINLYTEQTKPFQKLIACPTNTEKLNLSEEEVKKIFQGGDLKEIIFNSKWVITLHKNKMHEEEKSFLCLFDKQTQKNCYVWQFSRLDEEHVTCNETSIVCLSLNWPDYEIQLIQIETKQISSIRFPNTHYGLIDSLKALSNGLILLNERPQTNNYKWLLDPKNPLKAKQIGENHETVSLRIITSGNKLAIFYQHHIKIWDTSLPETTSQKLALKNADDFYGILHEDRLAICNTNRNILGSWSSMVKIYHLTKDQTFEYRTPTAFNAIINRAQTVFYVTIDRSQVVMKNYETNSFTVLDFLPPTEANQRIPTHLKTPGFLAKNKKTILKTVAIVTTFIALNTLSIIIIITETIAIPTQVRAISALFLVLNIGLVARDALELVTNFFLRLCIYSTYQLYLRLRRTPDSPPIRQLQVRVL